jgi:excisionase family DNA binding protein
MEGWAKIRQAATYSGVSVRTFRPWLKKGLKHVRLPSGTILIKFSDIDDFLSKFAVNENEIEQLADEIMQEI